MGATATIRLSEAILSEAKVRGRAEHRKPAQQIEYWVHIAQCVIDNPDLSFTEVKDILTGMAEADAGRVSEYKFG
jgi:predicted transcriptional regulator